MKYLIIIFLAISGELFAGDVQVAALINCESRSSRLRIRSSVDTSSRQNIVGHLNCGDEVEVTIHEELDNGWFHITYNGITGYSSGEFFSILSATKEVVDDLITLDVPNPSDEGCHTCTVDEPGEQGQSSGDSNSTNEPDDQSLAEPGLVADDTETPSESCTYTVRIWNTHRGRMGPRTEISKARSELTSEELGSIPGCSVCSEDQMEVTLSNGLPLTVCSVIAEQVRVAINDAIRSGFEVTEVLGYDPKRTTGRVDSSGNRTGLSNHSFGEAVDINRSANGLYNCNPSNSSCRPSHGGRWSERNPLSIQPDSELVINMNNIGLLWGGANASGFIDFMHFSPTGR